MNEVAVAMFLGAFGWRVTLIYVVSGILLGVVGGWLLSFFHLERYLSPWVQQLQQQSIHQTSEWEQQHVGFFQRFPSIVRDALGILIRADRCGDRSYHAWVCTRRLFCPIPEQ